METRNHFKAMGDVASANRFEQQALHCKKDLDVIRMARKHKHPVPRFHYETRSFSIVQSVDAVVLCVNKGLKSFTS